MKTRAQRRQDAINKAELLWTGLSQLRTTLDKGDPLGEIRVRVNELVGEAGRLVSAMNDT